ADSEVPPLADGESTPADAPSYFDRRELGAATIAVLAACQEAATRASPDLDDATRDSYCACVADAARSNARGERPILLTDPQLARCAEVARTQSASPLSRQFSTSTASIVSTFQACLTDLADDISTSYRGFVCDCATNAWITDRLRPSKLDQDLARCAVA